MHLNERGTSKSQVHTSCFAIGTRVCEHLTITPTIWLKVGEHPSKLLRSDVFSDRYLYCYSIQLPFYAIVHFQPCGNSLKKAPFFSVSA